MIAMAEKEWKGNTFGTAFMHRWLIRALRYSDVRFWYAFAAVFVIPFCMIFAKGARTSWRYFRRRHGYGRLRSLLMTYVNLTLFSQVVIDKSALYAGKRVSIKVVGSDIFRRLASAHVGCYEMAGYELVSDRKMFNALVYANEKASVMNGRSRLFADNHIRMIPITSDMSHLFRIEEALRGGEIVSIPADRVFGSRKTVGVSLLGAEASLPSGPFSVAAMRGLNVVAVNVMKTSARGYTAYVVPIDYDKTAPRREQVRTLADGYAAELERVLRMYPAQWYNFFDFWHDGAGNR